MLYTNYLPFFTSTLVRRQGRTSENTTNKMVNNVEHIFL